MPKKIGTSVLKKAKKIIPSRVELTIKPPSPLDFAQLKLEWEGKEKRELTDEEFQRRLRDYLRKYRRKERKGKLKMPKQLPYI